MALELLHEDAPVGAICVQAALLACALCAHSVFCWKVSLLLWPSLLQLPLIKLAVVMATCTILLMTTSIYCMVCGSVFGIPAATTAATSASFAACCAAVSSSILLLARARPRLAIGAAKAATSPSFCFAIWIRQHPASGVFRFNIAGLDSTDFLSVEKPLNQLLTVNWKSGLQGLQPTFSLNTRNHDVRRFCFILFYPIIFYLLFLQPSLCSENVSTHLCL